MTKKPAKHTGFHEIHNDTFYYTFLVFFGPEKEFVAAYKDRYPDNMADVEARRFRENWFIKDMRRVMSENQHIFFQDVV